MQKSERQVGLISSSNGRRIMMFKTVPQFQRGDGIRTFCYSVRPARIRSPYSQAVTAVLQRLLKGACFKGLRLRRNSAKVAVKTIKNLLINPTEYAPRI